MFFFSNRVGCLWSLVISAVGTPVLALAFGRIRLRAVALSRACPQEGAYSFREDCRCLDPSDPCA